MDSLIDQLRAELASGLRPDISAETLERIVKALEAGEVLVIVAGNEAGAFAAIYKWNKATQ